MVNSEDRTRQYTVYIADDKNSVSGSGVLFYPGGNTLFVFTCAHVVDGLNLVNLSVLRPVDIQNDLYEVYQISVPSDQIHYSPLDVVNEKKGERIHSEDFVIIQARKPEGFNIEPTPYYIGETSRNAAFYCHGYPNGVPEKTNPVEYLDCIHGSVLINIAGNSRFTIRITDPFLDLSSRVYELKGISGAPIWDGKQDDAMSLLGLISTAYDSTALLSKIFAVKAQQIRTLMNEEFGITIKRRLIDVPENDVAGSNYKPVISDGTLVEIELPSELERWIKERTSACRCYIDDLKMQKAINSAKETIGDPQFARCDKESQKKLMQHLLYCYEIVDLDSEFEALEKEMIEKGFFKKYDVLRHLTRSFSKRKYEETISVAEECLQDRQGENTLIALADSFLHLAKAYTENLPVEKTIGELLDEHGNVKFDLEEEDSVGLIYQMIGYVYGEKYHDYVNAVRFLNRSYQIGFDSVVLESLGAAYYFLGIDDALKEDQTVDLRKVDRRTLYKARECFLIIIGKADKLFWASSIRRIGMTVYNTFVFLQDNYRILTIYPDIKKYAQAPPDMAEDKFWQDVELKCARIEATSGAIDLNHYPHLHRTDRILLETMTKTCGCLERLDRAAVDLNPRQRKESGLERYVKNTIAETENNVRVIDRRERTSIYVQLMNMYGRGMQLFGWKKIDKLKYCFERIKDYGDQDLLISMENYIYEFEAPIEDVIKRFRETFEKKNNIQNWQELNHLYIRHNMMDKADQMYKELLVERKELISDEPEYAYRAYIDYITLYHRDLKDALQCYLDAKASFRDTDIQGFWELELMGYTNTFNNPERFEVERLPFLEKGLITEEQYHRGAFVAYLVNLDRKKANEHELFIAQYPHPRIINPVTNTIILQPAEIHFLNWIGQIRPAFLPPVKSMTERRATEVISLYMGERWHCDIGNQLKNRFAVDKTIAIDAWGLYILAETGGLEKIKECDRVYVSHLTIARLLEELSRTNNSKIRHVLDSIENNREMFVLESADFTTQIEIRNAVKYTEIAAAVAIGVQKDCLVILGEPSLDSHIIDRYKQRIVRVNEMHRLME